MPTEQNITPDRWVVVELTDGDTTFRKILSGWNGGYLNNDNWRLSSPIVNETEMKQYIEFVTDSGSTYKCLYAAEGMTGTTRDWFSNLQEQAKDSNDVTVKLLCYSDQT